MIMSDTNNYYCAICGADFASSRELSEHETERHSKHGAQRGTASADDRRRQQERKHHEFERRNWE
jgi:hypothetical protein